MSIKIEEIFPNFRMGLQNIGFFFGAGCSASAGYPVGNGFTKEVLARLSDDQKDFLTTFLNSKSISLSINSGTPDIETITDIIVKDLIITNNPKLLDIETQLRNNIINVITSVTDPDLTAHMKFLTCIKKLFTNRNANIWIFTTNYDLLFEISAMYAKIPIRNGFEGISSRYFDIDKIDLTLGEIKNSRFYQFKEPNIILIKLHGSISWFKDNLDYYEVFENNALKSSYDRVLILPRREKIISTLQNPYESLFRYSIRTMGEKCKYIVSCGYSLRDQHINEQLLIPKLRENKIKLFSLFESEPNTLSQFKQFTSFGYASSDKYSINGQEVEQNTDLWKFDKFVEFLINN